MSYEETVKAKLYELWLKEAYRIDLHNKGWRGERIMLGTGAVKIQGLTEVHKIISTIEGFGIDMDLLDVLKPSYDELNQIYNAINSYRIAVRKLKSLKDEMARKNHGYTD